MEEAKKKADRRKLAECLDDILKMPVSDAGEKDFLKKIGIEEAAQTNRTLVMAKLLYKGAQGDVSAIREIRSIMQEAEAADHGLMAEIIEAVRKVE